MDLISYLSKVGDAEAARILNAKQRTVKKWRLGDRYPRKEWRERIYNATGGIVSFGESYDKKPPATPTRSSEGKP